MAKKDETKLPNDDLDLVQDSKKIDLYINNQDDQEQGISIMNVFSTLGKRFKIFIWVIIVGLLAGLLAPTLMYTFKDKKESAVAVLGFDYAGAAAEKAPDGSKLDVTILKSPYVIENALNNVTLSKKVSTASVQANIVISRPLTDETKRQQEIIQELKEAKHNDYAEMVKNFVLRYREQYFVYLNNGFSDGGRNKIKLNSADLSHLMSAIMASYNDYFIETYQDRAMPSNLLAPLDEESADYLEILDEVSSSLTYLTDYCNNRASFIKGYRNKDGISFEDLSDVISTLQSADINYIYSYIEENNVYKDKMILQTYYEKQKRDAELDLVETNSNITTLENTIASYQDGQVVVQTTEGGTPVYVPHTDAEKSKLILELTNLNKQKTALEERISKLDDRLTKLNGTPATDEQKAKAEEYIQIALNDANLAYELVSKNAEELFNSNAYKSRYMHALTTSDSERLSDNLKLFAIGAAAGLFLGVLIWIADAFIIEFRNVKKANEEKEAK